MSIFKDGYLDPKYLNPNYRGLVGWNIEVGEGSDLFEGSVVYFSSDILICVTDEEVVTRDNLLDTDNAFKEKGGYDAKARIPKFTPKDIPKGELCWLKNGSSNYWVLEVLRGYSTPDNCYPYCTSGMGTGNIFWEYCVPYLIAETAEQAELLKDWAI